MTAKTDRTRVDRASAASYAAAAEQFFEVAGLARHLAYWNAAGVLYVHAAIAFADAVSIRLKGMKSTSDNHLDAVHLFDEATGDERGQGEAVRHLRRIVDEKNRVSYTGASFKETDLRTMEQHAERLRSFTGRVLR